MGPYDRFPYHKPLFSQVLHRVGFIHFQYHMKALWQSNYMHSIIIGSLRHQSIYSRVQQLYNHRYYGYIILYHICLLLEIFHFHVPKEDCRAVTWFGFVNCLLTPVMSGSLACWKTQSTVLQYRNLSTGLSTGLHWHRRPFWFWKIGHLKKKSLRKYKLPSVTLLLSECYRLFNVVVFFIGMKICNALKFTTQ